ncbi:nuclear protein localization protein 4, partial [Phenoliferia sp. Uapishka_3]
MVVESPSSSIEALEKTETDGWKQEGTAILRAATPLDTRTIHFTTWPPITPSMAYSPRSEFLDRNSGFPRRRSTLHHQHTNLHLQEDAIEIPPMPSSPRTPLYYGSQVGIFPRLRPLQMLLILITILIVILETSDSIDPATLALSNAPRGGENLVSAIDGDLASLGLRQAHSRRASPTRTNANTPHSHGDLLFASYTPLATPAANGNVPTPPIASTSSTLSGKIVPSEPVSSASPTTINAPRGPLKPWEEAKEKEDDVDKYWEKRDGKIARKKGQDMCKCGPKSMCDYCMPIEPYDSAYQTSHAIKHLSYHAYLQKINSSAPLSSQSTSYVPPLSDPSYRVAVPCTSGSHPSWPAGICTKCQPSAVTLTRQTYRLVDHVEFAKPEIVEGLLSFWRTTGTQRFGYLLGRYEPYEEVPMGIKAVVEAVHEPPQEPHADGVAVGFPWEDEARVEQLAAACGLKVVGMIYTDLTADTTPEGKKEGKVLPKRHANSFFLSSLEVIFSAALQRKHPNPSRYSDSGFFSSKFVTCVLSADLTGAIAVEAYQVSDQAMGMVEADMIEASVDPGVVRVKEEIATRYIPDVFYRYKNKYGIEVKESAKPCFPVEYLLVNVTHGFPKQPNPLFISETAFTIENRAGVQEQSMPLVASRFLAAAKDISPAILDGSVSPSSDEKGKGKETDLEQARSIVKWLSDWHLLAYLESLGIFDPADVKLMARIGSSKSLEDLAKLFQSPSWHTFLTIAEESAPAVPTRDYPGAAPDKFDDGFEIPPDVDVPPESYGANGGGGGDVHMDDAGGAAPPNGAATGGSVVCPHCTFENDAGKMDCDICGLPLAG